MPKRFRDGIAACILAILFVLPFCSPAAAAAGSAGSVAGSAGSVNYFLMASSPWDRFTSDPAMESWFTTHIWRMGVFSPYFDEKTSWYPDGWVYDDSYAIYQGSALAAEHPEWILRDSAGNPLYIPFGCSGGSCPQYAGDIASPAYRQAWIGNLEAELAHGYRGVFIDDVNMEMRVGNGAGESVAPINPSTGRAMSAEEWRGYMAQFMQQVRAELPNVEIVHNVIWFADGAAGTANANIRAEIESANYINLERGVNDAGLSGGDGGWSVNALLSYAEEIHALHRGVILDGVAGDPQGLVYNLAEYFLVSTGNDAVAGGEQLPENWWSGWSVELGEATGARYAWHGLIRRDFSGGMVLLNEPGEPTQQIELATPMLDANGNTVTSVTLASASGAVLRSIPGTPPPSEQPVEATPTKTTVEASAPTALPSREGGSAAGAQSPSSARAPAAATSTPRTKHSAHPARKRRARTSRRAGRAARTQRVTTRIAGRVLRATRGKVTIQLQLRRGGRWVTVARVPVSLSSTGSFTRAVELPAGARYRVRASYEGVPGFRPSRSGYLLLSAHTARVAHTRAG